ncbi:MAG: 50S ribosomal protein L24 [Gammaproteobacteria bacterium]
MKRKLRKGDEVIVLAGRDKGRRGEVLSVDPIEGLVIVQNINQVKKHVRPNPRSGEQGGIRTQEAAMAIGKVAIYNPTSGKADRVGYKEENGKKVRVFKSSGEEIK